MSKEKRKELYSNAHDDLPAVAGKVRRVVGDSE